MLRAQPWESRPDAENLRPAADGSGSTPAAGRDVRGICSLCGQPFGKEHVSVFGRQFHYECYEMIHGRK